MPPSAGRTRSIDLWDWLAELKPRGQPHRAVRRDARLVRLGPRSAAAPRKMAGAGLGGHRTAHPRKSADPLLDKMNFILGQSPDVINSLKLWDQLPDERPGRKFPGATHILDLSAAERWDEAAAVFPETDRPDFRSPSWTRSRPCMPAPPPACARRAGPSEAAAQDSLVEKLALGNDAHRNRQRLRLWLRLQACGGMVGARRAADATRLRSEFADALQLHAEMLMEQGKWKEVAAISEVRAQMMASVDSESVTVRRSLSLRLRLQADLGRALASLKTDRAGAIAMLGKLPPDVSLATARWPTIFSPPSARWG